MYSARKKNWASIAKETMKATRLEPRKERERKKPKSTIGATVRRSITAKATIDAIASASSPITRAEPQCQALPSTSASTIEVNPTVIAAIPGRSTLRVTVSSRVSRVANRVTATAPIAIGGVMKKIARQLTCSVRKHPATGALGKHGRLTPGPGANRHASLGGGERLRDDPQRGRHHECGADPLHGAECDQRVIVRREPD